MQEAQAGDAGTNAAQCRAVAVYLDEGNEKFEVWLITTYQFKAKLLRLVKALETVQRAAAFPANADVFARYQSALDNDVYKATRALRDAQKSRIEQAALNARHIDSE